MGWALRRWDITKLTSKMQQGRRLQMLEQLHLDAKRKVALIRCDHQEYLLVMGVQGEQIIALASGENTPQSFALPHGVAASPCSERAQNLVGENHVS
jgi:flagellar protein FliO/FliZ